MIKRIAADLKKIKICILFIILYLLVAKFLFKAVCPMVLITGLPCPGCGMTRAGMSMLRFDFKQAFYYNPCCFMWAAYFMYMFIQRYVLGNKIKYRDALGIIVGLVTLGVYVYRMATCFPSEAPLTFTYDNMLQHIFSDYNNLIEKFFNL